MSDKKKALSRRNFLKIAGATGITSVLKTDYLLAEKANRDVIQNEKVSTRPFGKTGEKVSILSLGGMFDIPTNQIILKHALKWGVTNWDTANSYGGGRSEIGIGQFFEKNPDERKQVF